MSMSNGAPPVWREARNADGRIYYFHSITQETKWEKPAELMTAAERNLQWKEFTAPGGRKYWNNAESGVTTWDMPAEVKAAQEEAQNQALQHSTPTRPSAPQFVAGGSDSFQGNNNNQLIRAGDRDDYQRPERQMPGPSFGASAIPPSNEPELPMNEAEANFFKLLRRVNAQPDWTWDQAMRATVKDPAYRQIRDPRDRKIAFEKFITEARAADKEREKERQAKTRADFLGMLRTHPEIKYYTRWKTARPIIQKETLFKAARDEDEKIQLFTDYRNELYKEHIEQEVADHKSASAQLDVLLQSLNLEPYTRWSDAQGIIQSNEQFQADDTFKSLNKLDIVKAFEKHIMALEKTFNATRQQQKLMRARRERQNRDNFQNLLEELKSAGKIRAGTKWMEIHPLIEDDPRYVAMLGQAGSTPLDMFWDMVEMEEDAFRAIRNAAYDVSHDKQFEVDSNTTFEEFKSVMQTDPRTAHFDDDTLTQVLNRICEKNNRKLEEERQKIERQQRRAVDDLRSKIKHLEPPVLVGDTWDQVRLRIEKFEEYRFLETEELQRSAFDKVIRRLKEKEEEKEHSRRDRKERDRSHRNGHSKRSRSPGGEVNTYEADRRKAMADRERNYGKKGVTSFSPPPPRARDRDDRYDVGRSKRQVSSSIYDRERRESERERERSYVSRADPRDRASELDYGDSRPPSLRRRRDSEAESPRSARDIKRLRKDRLSRERTFSPRPKGRSKTPQVAPPKEDPGLRSGSEEGEIEED
ncbi:hypothetical protein EJ08DRAFT_632807 [Tothia fuscella]|uniref:Uncharacterized protein n=1 Tax=Tothia fuscella TaxID=1048955 RepID=A0A9P4NTP0_9PEZI|nr:hypothetical protein EJ08DRAFT_632807 [Tothia fuscella]